MVAHLHGNVWNAAELARSLGSSENTTRRYLDILADTFMVRILPRWFENLSKRQVKSPKVYVRDSGVLHSGHRYGFEFKLADAPGISRSMRIALNDLGLAHLWVVYPGETAYELDEAISVLPLEGVPELCWTLQGQVLG